MFNMADSPKIYGIHRCEKRGRQAITGIENENNRKGVDQLKFKDGYQKKKFKNSDIDAKKSDQNVYLKKSDDWYGDIKKRIGDIKYKSNAVLMIDGIYTASPDWFKDKTPDEIKDYFDDCLEWHIKTYCHDDDTLVINAVIHYDETTPHLHVVSVPITEDGRLCAKEIMGNRKAYSERQDSFYEDVTKSRGLERGEIGEPGNHRKHRTSQQMKMQREKKDAIIVTENLKSLKTEVTQWNNTILDLQNRVENLKDENEDYFIKNKQLFDAKINLQTQVNDLKIERDGLLKEIENLKKIKYIKGTGKVVHKGEEIQENAENETSGVTAPTDTNA